MKKGVMILLVVLAVVVVAYVATNQFSTVRTVITPTGEKLEWDTEVACTTAQDCVTQIRDWPADGYCKDGTCRFLDTAIEEVPK